MKRLTLLRHAKSDWDDRTLPDHERPLAPRGLRDAPRMGRRLARQGLAPDLILTSSAKRARQTAELVRPALEHSGTRLAVDPTIYHASPDTLLSILAAQGDDIDEVLLVGHNPVLTELVNRLLPSLELDNLPTAGAVAMECAIERWADIADAEPKLLFYDYPKKEGSDPFIREQSSGNRV